MSYILNPGKSFSEIASLQVGTGLKLPDELEKFYEFTYGAKMHGYRLLTIPEIVQSLAEIRDIYEVQEIEWLVPFAYLVDVGDFVSFDLRRSNADRPLILDCFHELPPDEWKGICYGLENWMRRMANSGFDPFWLK